MSLRPCEAHRAVPGRVAAEQLIGTFSHLANDHAGIARQFGNEVHRQAYRVGQRFVLVPDDHRQRVEQVAFLQQQFVMFRADILAIWRA